MIADLMGLPPRARDPILSAMTVDDLAVLFAAARRETGSPYGLWADDCVGFVNFVVGEPLWSGQQRIAESVVEHRRTAVPACHSAAKTFVAGRIVAWFVAVWPPGTVQVVTTATKVRQVKLQLWPHIRRVVERAGLPGACDMMQWKINEAVVAYGFSSGDYDETAFSGIHAPHLLAVVDEAGGISPTLGESLESLMSGLHARLLVIGNPPVDEDLASPWFEERTLSPLYNVVRISAYDTPNFTGEPTPRCRTCPPEVPPHPIADHLVSRQWVADTIADYGPDSRYVEARVRARFPHGGPSKAIPQSWIEDAVDNDDPVESTWVRLGVDIAAEGGDEFVIARAEGFRVRIVHHSSGEANSNPVDVAGVVLREIRSATEVARKLGSDKKVRVKIDSIGLGWGVVGILRAWGSEGLHDAEIVGVNVAERAVKASKFANKRAEMWWNGRRLLQPRGDGQGATVKLIIDRQTVAQLAAPNTGTDTSGRQRIQKKSELKAKGLGSPDRADGILLALYESAKPATGNAGAIAAARLPS